MGDFIQSFVEIITGFIQSIIEAISNLF